MKNGGGGGILFIILAIIFLPITISVMALGFGVLLTIGEFLVKYSILLISILIGIIAFFIYLGKKKDEKLYKKWGKMFDKLNKKYLELLKKMPNGYINIGSFGSVNHIYIGNGYYYSLAGFSKSNFFATIKYKISEGSTDEEIADEWIKIYEDMGISKIFIENMEYWRYPSEHNPHINQSGLDYANIEIIFSEPNKNYDGTRFSSETITRWILVNKKFLSYFKQHYSEKNIKNIEKTKGTQKLNEFLSK